MKLIRITLLTFALAIFIYAFFFESHSVSSYESNEISQVNGGEYIYTIEDGLLLRDPRNELLFNGDTLVPEAAQLDDCPT